MTSPLTGTAAPTLAFVVADGIGGLRPALVATMAAAVLVLGWGLRNRRRITRPGRAVTPITRCAHSGDPKPSWAQAIPHESGMT
ncbi:hypothetical protein KO481_15390 [Nocardia sp. NEAU-G5]|uniref:Uncharacterized protein n=1 Tax=Nocardia albiluteola TaxID=2842303 RepID=A0ABS6AYE2_9NOCA|nr:hypothetical protein [Nocardia albiluteola]MBU3062903.1 hypothetical protein [Nocardia albiluteola]